MRICSRFLLHLTGLHVWFLQEQKDCSLRHIDSAGTVTLGGSSKSYTHIQILVLKHNINLNFLCAVQEWGWNCGGYCTRAWTLEAKSHYILFHCSSGEQRLSKTYLLIIMSYVSMIFLLQILTLLQFGGYTLVRNSTDLFRSFGFDTQPVLIGLIIFQVCLFFGFWTLNS